MADQAIEQSVEERLMANLEADLPEQELEAEEAGEQANVGAPEEAGEEVEAEAAAETEESDPSEVLNIDGEEYEVPAKLKDAFMRQQDYTKKTQELASQRKALEEQIALTQQQAQFQQQYQQDVAQLTSLDAQIKQYEAVNWNELQNNDPLQFVTLREQYRDLKDARNYYSQELNQRQQQQAIQAQQHYAKLAEQGAAELRNSIKGWGQERAREIREFGMETYGFADNELANVIDPRIVKVLHDAYLYRKGQSVSNKKVIGKPKLGKPQAQQAQAKQTDIKLRQALKKTGKADYAAAMIERLL